MSPGAHLLSSWLLANSFQLRQRERRIVTIAGLSPDLDGIGWFVDRANILLGNSSDYFFQYHHVLGHNLLASFVIAGVCSALAHTRKQLVFFLAIGVVHLHLLCDLVGSKGPDGYQWPIRYLYPFDPEHQWVWSGQWELHAWQNTAITLTMLVVSMAWAWRQRYSFIQVISSWLDREFFEILARRNLRSQ